MGISLTVAPSSLSDDDLFTLFALADEQNDTQAAAALADEIYRRSKASVPVQHEVPKVLLWLPRFMWHSKPSGGGEGIT